jgi:hypothetical protein
VSDLNETLIFLTDFPKTQTSNFIKIHPGAKLFYADTRMDMTKLTVTFHNFVNTPKTRYLIILSIMTIVIMAHHKSYKMPVGGGGGDDELPCCEANVNTQ